MNIKQAYAIIGFSIAIFAAFPSHAALIQGSSFITPSTLNAETLPPSAALQVQATLTYIPGNEDYAGPWHVFGPGLSRITGDPRDWHLQLDFSTLSDVTVTELTFFHNQMGFPDEAWSTTSNQHFGKLLYPIVVMDSAAKQLNTDYDQLLGPFAAGSYQLNLFMQRENPVFGGGNLIVKFSDGSEISRAVIPVPAAVWLLGSAMGGLFLARRCQAISE